MLGLDYDMLSRQLDLWEFRQYLEVLSALKVDTVIVGYVENQEYYSWLDMKYNVG